MLEFIYYPVSFILWCWHWVFGHVFGEASAVSWVLGIMFLVFTLRAIMFKPFVKQVRSMRQMQQFAPEIKKIQQKYKNDKQKQAAEMQKLQREHGFSPLGGCLPMLLQIPVFIGLYHVLRSFGNSPNENYFFKAREVASYLDANLFGARLSTYITQPEAELITKYHADRTSVILVSIPLMILASALTHLTAKHSVDRQNPDSATPQTAIMNKITLYVFPLGVLVFGLFFPIGLLVYWLANNSWTLMQQRLVYRRIDAEEEQKKTEVVEKRSALGPKPGQRPTQARKRPPVKPVSADPDAAAPEATEESPTKGNGGPKPGQKPAQARKGPAYKRVTPRSNTSKPAPAEESATKGNGSPAPKKPTAGKQPLSNDKPTDGGTEVPGLIADRSRSKRSGRKNR